MAIGFETAAFDAVHDSEAYQEPGASVRYRIADVDVEVRGPRTAVVPLERAFARLPHAPADGGSAVAIEVRHGVKGWVVCETFSEQPRILGNRPGGGWLAMEVANSIMSEVASRSKFLILHAAVLERQGGALLVAGRAFAGKSTIASHLLARGWRMLSDEYALIEPVTGSVVPYQKMMFLRSGVIPMLPSSFRRSVELSPWYGSSNESLGFYAVDPSTSYGEHVWANHAQLRAVALLDGEHGERPSLSESDPWSLIPEFQALSWRSDDLLSGLAKLASALRGVYVAVVQPGRPLETADALEAWYRAAAAP